MSLKTLTLSSSTAALFFSFGAVAYGQSIDSADQVVNASYEATQRSRSAGRARAYVNPLRTPDTSTAYAETDNGQQSSGVMTRRGAINTDRSSSRRAYGSFGIPYTTTRVQDGVLTSLATAANRESATYPYSTIGKLTFTTDTGRASWCSASVIRRGIIVTAAHCIQRFGSRRTLFTNFSFQPGHYGARGATASQIAPNGTWRTAGISRAGSWAAGTDVGSGAARDNDLALVAIRPQSGRFIGDETGYLTYAWNNYSFVSSPKTGNLLTGAVSSLGYPALMDAGSIMQRTDGPTYPTTVSDARQLWQGSNLTGGASGGPWIVNFASRRAALSGGAVAGTASVMAVVGVTSWGSRDPNAPKDNYSSQFAQNARYPNADYGGYGAGNIGSLMNTLCNASAPGGGTYESQGYCN